MVVKKAANKPAVPETSRLTRDDWLDAAFHAVVEGGFDAVRVLVLAEQLGVTRGSFYWHFADHAELISALLARWRQREIALDQSFQDSATEDPVADLERLLDVALAHGGPDLENMRFELALRGVGRRDPAVAEMLSDVDKQRMKVFRNTFMRATGDLNLSTDLASLFYLAIVGSNQALSRPAVPARLKDYLKSVITEHLIHQKIGSPSAARAQG
jgi:AcrR family transcriptional regulator